jgi:hypothetical protein
VLHLLNGDATAAVFPDTLPGERAVWRDILMEGPADADADTRAAWLAPRLGVSADAYARRWREGIAMLSRAKEQDEVVLWFERDLFCTLNLWFVLTRLDVSRVSLVFPALDADFRGLGTLDSGHFSALFERRERLGLDEIRDAHELWRAYAAPDPTALARYEPILPFARSAIRLHSGRFPSAIHALDELEHETLATLDEPIDFGALFRRVTSIRPLNELGLGDVQFAATLSDLAAGPRRSSRSPTASNRCRAGGSREPPRRRMCSPAVSIASHWRRSIGGWAACTSAPAHRSGGGTVVFLR